jgi:hypothetical protein
MMQDFEPEINSEEDGFEEIVPLKKKMRKPSKYTLGEEKSLAIFAYTSGESGMFIAELDYNPHKPCKVIYEFENEADREKFVSRFYGVSRL